MKWETRALGDVCEIVMGQSPDGSTYNSRGDGVPLLNGPTEFGALHPVAKQWTTAPTKFCREGDILYCVRGATLGRMNLADQPYCMGRGLAAIRATADADTGFVWFVLRTVTAKVLDESAGSTFPSITGEKLAAVSVPLPPLPEQKRIAARLREQLAEVEKARHALQSQLEAAEKIHAAALRSAIDGALRSGPTIKMDRLVSITAAQVDPTKEAYRSLPHVSAENIEAGTGKLLPVRSAAEDGMTSGKYLFEQGDVLYSKLRPYLRKVTMAPFRGLCSADMYPLKVNEMLLLPTFAIVLLLSEAFTEYAVGASQRSRMPKLNREQLFGWEVRLPTLERQASIVAELDAMRASTQSLIASIRARLEAVEKLPAALLREVFAREP